MMQSGKEIDFLAGEMVRQAKDMRASLTPEQNVIIDALAYAKILQLKPLNHKELCAAMRADALKHRTQFPLLTAYIECAAKALDTATD